MKLKIEVLEAATAEGVRVVKGVNVNDEAVPVGGTIVVDGVSKVEVRELGVGGSGSDPFPSDGPPSS